MISNKSYRKPHKLEFSFRFVTAFCILSCFLSAVLTFDRNTQRTHRLLPILIHFRPTSSSKKKRWKILSIFISHLYLLSCAGYPLYSIEGIIGQDVLRII